MKYLKFFEHANYTKVEYNLDQKFETFSFSNKEVDMISKVISEHLHHLPPYNQYKVSNIGNKSRLDIYHGVLTGENLVLSVVKEKDRWYYIHIWESDKHFKSDIIEGVISCIEDYFNLAHVV